MNAKVGTLSKMLKGTAKAGEFQEPDIEKYLEKILREV